MRTAARISLPATAGPLAALALVGAERLSAGLSVGRPILAALALVLAPGLAALPFLPRELRSDPPVLAAVVPIVGLALSSVLLVSISAAGVALTGTNVRLALAATAAAALVGSAASRSGSAPERRHRISATTTLLLLAAATCLGVALQALILGGTPLPGEDWGEYLLYAEQAARHHSLLIDNPYWMLGGHPFPQDPGAPSLYAGYLLLSGQAAASLAQGIWVFAALAIFAVFVLVAALWGRVAGLLAATVYAAVPMNLDMLSWHGLANVWALCLLPVALLATGAALRGTGDPRWAALLALSLVALAAAHRFSFVLGAIAIGVALAVAFARRFRGTVGFVAWACVFLVVGTGVAADLVRRNTALHGTQGYRAFLPTKVHWHLVIRDLTWPVFLAGLAALVLVLVRRHRDDDAPALLVGLGVAILVLTYGWVAHIPTAYNRASYFLPLLLAAALGVAGSRTLPRLAVPLVAALVLATAVQARPLARDYRGFYAHVDAASLRGLGYASSLARPRDAFVTDQCWSFLATWLLHRRVLAALDPSLILPKTELVPAARARRILYGNPVAGLRTARRLGISFGLVDPQCTYQTGAPYGAPHVGRLVYASTRLLVLDLRPRS